MIKVMV